MLFLLSLFFAAAETAAAYITVCPRGDSYFGFLFAAVMRSGSGEGIRFFTVQGDSGRIEKSHTIGDAEAARLYWLAATFRVRRRSWPL